MDEDDRIAYLRVTQFNDQTLEELGQALAAILPDGINAMILDLRGNPGGELGAAIEMADLFLRSGTIVSVRGRSRRPQSWQAREERTLPDFPMIVLVNRHSASASEIVAGALQENDRAKVLGTRTFGKGSVQEVHDLPYGQGTLKLTAGHYYLPSGRNISRGNGGTLWGVDPDPGYVITVSDEGYRDLLLARREYTIIRPDSGEHDMRFDDPVWIRETLKDKQLAAALESIRAHGETGEWPTVSEEDATAVALDQRLDAQARLRRALLEQLAAVEESLAELSGTAAEAGIDLMLPDDADLAGGLVTVADASGQVVGQYRITEGDLETALRHAPLDPIDSGE